mmetsp:Transcript_17200/g.28825  ORF Transcript_17200/g.28825 Transcript_17200/m.28825 type:complete len:167 (+) Transcript_17200:47-547(+)
MTVFNFQWFTGIYISSRILFWTDALFLLGASIPILLYPGVLLRKWYLPGKTPELMADTTKQLVLLLWIAAGLVSVLGLVALALAVSPVERENGWIYVAFAFYHGAGFVLCFFHILHAELYGFDKRLNTFWCVFNGTLCLCFITGMLGNVLFFPKQWGVMPEHMRST